MQKASIGKQNLQESFLACPRASRRHGLCLIGGKDDPRLVGGNYGAPFRRLLAYSRDRLQLLDAAPVAATTRSEPPMTAASRGLYRRTQGAAPAGQGVAAPSIPCGSCPYRCNVPPGIWDASEYEKLPLYDNPTWAQPLGLFMCHQKDGHLCAGWLACHDKLELLALRVHGVDPSVFSYESPVPVFASGQAAYDHGVAGIKKPGVRARKMIAGLERKRAFEGDPYS